MPLTTTSWAPRPGRCRCADREACRCIVLARPNRLIVSIDTCAAGSVIGRKLFELCAIIGARELDQQYAWTGHEAAALQFGVSQKAVDTIKFNRPLEGLPEDEMVVIQMGRQILRDMSPSWTLHCMRTRSSCSGGKALWRWPSVVGDYVLAGIMLITADQQLPPDHPPTYYPPAESGGRRHKIVFPDGNYG